MRLIDVDKLMQDIRNTITEQSSTIDWLNLINRQPTAYDVDAVVKQLEMKIDNAEFDELLTSNEKDAYVDAYRRSIEVVKGGGVDNA